MLPSPWPIPLVAATRRDFVWEIVSRDYVHAMYTCYSLLHFHLYSCYINYQMSNGLRSIINELSCYTLAVRFVFREVCRVGYRQKANLCVQPELFYWTKCPDEVWSFIYGQKRQASKRDGM
jgi:hypothetical protein